ncbi:MAG: aminoacyl-tRNA hydrolase [Mycoplasma sp.]|nr:aminoacyl-tRNA hydrolase [Mycoplasma sp.]
MEKFLIVGLGNPGDKYKFTKHNAGFLVIDKILEKLNLVLDKEKFSGWYTKYKIENKEVFICKPYTYMNNSVFFIFNICNFFKIPIENILVIYDDIDTEIGNLRIRLKGSSGGQNGMKGIIQTFGTENIKRIRIGIGNPKGRNLADYVLSNFSNSEKIIVDKVFDRAADAALFFLKEDFEKVISKYNS